MDINNINDKNNNFDDARFRQGIALKTEGIEGNKTQGSLKNFPHCPYDLNRNVMLPILYCVMLLLLATAVFLSPEIIVESVGYLLLYSKIFVISRSIFP